MKLMCEQLHDVRQVIEEGADGKKTLYIEGVYMQSELQNRNGRKYPLEVMEKEVARYNAEEIAGCRAYGELGHPSGPAINLDRVSHLIESLKMDGKNVIGRARVVDTPCGQIVKGLIEGGANLGVSSRGLGTLKPVNGIMEVQNDFRICTAADIVANPSAPDAFVKGIMEGVEYFYNDNGILQATSENSKAVIKTLSKRQLDESKLRLFEHFLNQIAQGRK